MYSQFMMHGQKNVKCCRCLANYVCRLLMSFFSIQSKKMLMEL